MSDRPSADQKKGCCGSLWLKFPHSHLRSGLGSNTHFGIKYKYNSAKSKYKYIDFLDFNSNTNFQYKYKYTASFDSNMIQIHLHLPEQLEGQPGDQNSLVPAWSLTKEQRGY